MGKYKKVLIVLGILMLIVLVIGYFQFYTGNVKEDGTIYIPTGATYGQVEEMIEPYLKDMSSFQFIAERRGYPDYVKPGKYALEVGDSNMDIVDRLYRGEQTPENVKVKSYWSVYDMSGDIAQYFEADSLAFIEAITKRAKEKNLSVVDAYKVYIFPDTYQYYWTDKPEKYLDKMEAIYEKFWTPERDAKAKAQNLNRLQADVLASIVQRETIKSDEQPEVARLYLNRLAKGMPLQADPTLVYLRQTENNYNAKINRVYNKDKTIDSPYNTYMYKGLPPLPICIPYKGAVEAVLNPADNDYIFMCAQPGRTGYHNFSDNYADHQKNAKLYTDWADANNVK